MELAYLNWAYIFQYSGKSDETYASNEIGKVLGEYTDNEK